ncbi:hypothetical protein ACFFSP_21280 [Persicitalea jodogahamensis]
MMSKTTTQQKIQQTQSAIRLLEMQLSAGRARPEQIEPLRVELAALQKMANAAPVGTSTHELSTVRSQKVSVKPPVVKSSSDRFADKQAELTAEASKLRKEQAELSNMLHKVPAHQDCPELTERIVALQNEIEGIWDEKKFIERNGIDAQPVFRPESEPSIVVQARTLDDVAQKAVLTTELQRLREKRSKLTRKLGNPKASPSKKAEWETELAKVGSQIEQMVGERHVL